MERNKLIPAIQSIAPEIPLPKYLTPKGESFSFLVFENDDSAKSFYEKFEGVIKLDSNGSKHGEFIYMAYTKNGRLIILRVGVYISIIGMPP